MDAWEERHPKLYLALGIVVFAAFAIADLVRLVLSPMRGTSGYDLALSIGGGLGIVSAVAWIVAVRRSREPIGFNWWIIMTSVAFLVSIVSTHPRGHTFDAVTHPFQIGALVYEEAAFLGTALCLAVVIAHRNRVHVPPPRPRSVTLRRRPPSKIRTRH